MTVFIDLVHVGPVHREVFNSFSFEGELEELIGRFPLVLNQQGKIYLHLYIGEGMALFIASEAKHQPHSVPIRRDQSMIAEYQMGPRPGEFPINQTGSERKG